MHQHESEPRPCWAPMVYNVVQEHAFHAWLGRPGQSRAIALKSVILLLITFALASDWKCFVRNMSSDHPVSIQASLILQPEKTRNSRTDNACHFSVIYSRQGKCSVHMCKPESLYCSNSKYSNATRIVLDSYSLNFDIFILCYTGTRGKTPEHPKFTRLTQQNSACGAYF